jgi:DnaK suppressor protein
MNNTDFELLKTTLQNKLKTIVTGSDKRGDIVIQQSADALDQTQFAAERDLVVTLLNRDTVMSRRVKAALGRMEDGTYGICLTCEDSISVKRLQAVPWAELCLRCQDRSDLTAAGVLGAGQGEGVQLEIG